MRPLDILVRTLEERHIRLEERPRLLVRDVLAVQLLISAVELVNVVLERLGLEYRFALCIRAAFEGKRSDSCEKNEDP